MTTHERDTIDRASGAPLVALTRAVPRTIVDCELTHLERTPIDYARAVDQHDQYERALAALGVTVQRIPAEHALPDSVFVEDTVVVLDELAVIARPGAESRRPEIATMESALAPHRLLVHIENPGTLDGGDVLCIGRRIFVGQSGRTNHDGIRQMRELLSPFGYSVHGVEVTGCLHLKSAVTQVAPDTVLLNPAWVDASMFTEHCIAVHPNEPHAANALRVGGTVLFPAHFPRTMALLQQRGVRVHDVECDELAKAEAGLTCCSVIVPQTSKSLAS